MEPIKEQITKKQERLMLRLIMGKFRVVEVRDREIRIDMGNGIGMIVALPNDGFDVRPGDLCTYYTEIPYKGLKDPDA